MEEIHFPGGVWPVMLTPFTHQGQVDYKALEKLVDWYILRGVKGLFAVCQSSEMFYLSLEERLNIARKVVAASAGRVPVIASGHISESMEDQIHEINEMAKTGVEAVILITNRIAKAEEDEAIWMSNCRELLKKIDSDIPLGFYECPYPYKRVLSAEILKECANTGRFYFLKDTCCDIHQIKKKLEAVKGTNLKLYNANTTTLLASLRYGATGYSGVMANFHPQLYAYLCDHCMDKGIEALEDFLAIASLIERQYYPVNAKFYLQNIEGLPITTYTRTQDEMLMTETFKAEIEMLHNLSQIFEFKYSGDGKEELGTRSGISAS